MSNIIEVNSLMYSLTKPVFINLFNLYLARQEVLLGRNWSHISFINLSYVSILGHPAVTSYAFGVLHQSFASPVNYIMVIFNLLVSGTLAAVKYCSISQMKFSNSLSLLVPQKYLGSGILTVDNYQRFELNAAITRHSTTLYAR